MTKYRSLKKVLEDFDFNKVVLKKNEHKIGSYAWEILHLSNPEKFIANPELVLKYYNSGVEDKLHLIDLRIIPFCNEHLKRIHELSEHCDILNNLLLIARKSLKDELPEYFEFHPDFEPNGDLDFSVLVKPTFKLYKEVCKLYSLNANIPDTDEKVSIVYVIILFLYLFKFKTSGWEYKGYLKWVGNDFLLPEINGILLYPVYDEKKNWAQSHFSKVPSKIVNIIDAGIRDELNDFTEDLMWSDDDLLYEDFDFNKVVLKKNEHKIGSYAWEILYLSNPEKFITNPEIVLKYYNSGVEDKLHLMEQYIIPFCNEHLKSIKTESENADILNNLLSIVYSLIEDVTLEKATEYFQFEPTFGVDDDLSFSVLVKPTFKLYKEVCKLYSLNANINDTLEKVTIVYVIILFLYLFELKNGYWYYEGPLYWMGNDLVPTIEKIILYPVYDNLRGHPVFMQFPSDVGEIIDDRLNDDLFDYAGELISSSDEDILYEDFDFSKVAKSDNPFAYKNVFNLSKHVIDAESFYKLYQNGYITPEMVLHNILPACSEYLELYVNNSEEKLKKMYINLFYIINGSSDKCYNDQILKYIEVRSSECENNYDIDENEQLYFQITIRPTPELYKKICRMYASQEKIPNTNETVTLPYILLVFLCIFNDDMNYVKFTGKYTWNTDHGYYDDATLTLSQLAIEYINNFASDATTPISTEDEELVESIDTFLHKCTENLDDREQLLWWRLSLLDPPEEPAWF